VVLEDLVVLAVAVAEIVHLLDSLVDHQISLLMLQQHLMEIQVVKVEVDLGQAAVEEEQAEQDKHLQQHPLVVLEELAYSTQ
jgi:hypothetical protein